MLACYLDSIRQPQQNPEQKATKMKTTYTSRYVFDDAFRSGFDAGKQVPAGTANREQAWSDFRAQNERGEITHGEDTNVANEYIRGHMEGQTNHD